MNGKEPQQSEGSTEELLRQLIGHPRIRQAIMSGVTAAIVAELAVLGLQDQVDASRLVDVGKVKVNATRFQTIGIVTERVDDTSGGGR